MDLPGAPLKHNSHFQILFILQGNFSLMSGEGLTMVIFPVHNLLFWDQQTELNNKERQFYWNALGFSVAHIFQII